MSRAYLTVDDGPSVITRDFIDFLTDQGIKPVFFFIGQHIEEQFEAGVYAITKGAIIGNHSYSHPNFEKLTYEECIEEVEKTEELIKKLYQQAGEKRLHKLFRFPYGARNLAQTKEVNQAKKFQEYLKLQGFCKLDDSDITNNWYEGALLKEGLDELWTFDFTEYRMHMEDSITYEDLMKRIHEKKEGSGDSLLEKDSKHIILLHDHPETDGILPRYYEKLLNHVRMQGVSLLTPEFIFI